MGARSVKTGQSRWFIGYKKHTLRLWISSYEPAVLLAPLTSWVAPASRGDVLFLEPSIRWCRQHLDFTPEYVVADMAYINFNNQRRLREDWQVGVVTSLPANYYLPKKLEVALQLRCPQGQVLQWLGFHPAEQLHWFGVRDVTPLCPWCWEQVQCAREFCFAASDHEIVLGSLPLNSSVARRLLRQVRKWIEAAQSYEKNQLGLGAMFLNSLRLTWTVALLADTACLLRCHALLHNPPSKSLLYELLPRQMELELD